MDIAITSGYVVPVDGNPIDGGTVLISDGKITAVGTASEVTVPDGAEIVDASGQWVLPGFVEAHGHIGVHEESVGWAGDDTNEMTDPNGARMRALDRSEEHTSELQSRFDLVCRLLLEKKNKNKR